MPRTITPVVWGRCRPTPDRVPEGASSDAPTMILFAFASRHGPGWSVAKPNRHSEKPPTFRWGSHIVQGLTSGAVKG
ncbi:hypothetical protein GCM10018966_076110 [Streptomyces yanii]